MATKVINLNDLFPESEPGVERGPLPKQQQFMESVINNKDHKYVLYAGGVGSGKTAIGCITTITLAVMFPGDYLVCRLFNPELKLTTYRTLLEMCPKDLIVEHRVADQILIIKSAGGKTSSIIFRGLEDYDKHRSLNLNAAYIDESSQVSEEAFTLLQTRLRGKHVRKIYMTTNPNGHSWLWRYFVKPGTWAPEVAKNFKCISAPSTENKHLPSGYVDSMLATWTEDRIKREVMGSWDSFSGQVYSEFDRSVHVIKPFKIPSGWTRVMGGDHGYVAPAAFVWGAIDYDGNVYIYREFYEREWLIKEICHGKDGKPGIVKLSGGEKIDGCYIDPSTRSRRGQEGISDWDHYITYLPKTFPLLTANNDVTAGIDKVKTYLKPGVRTGKPKIYIFDTCHNLLDEITEYHWEELPAGMEGRANAKERPRKYKDHACFVAGTLVETLEGPKPIEQVTTADRVLTSLGFKPVKASGLVGIKPVYDYGVFTSTDDHPVLLASGKKLAVKDLTPLDTFYTLEECKYYLTESYLEKLVITTERMAQSVVRELSLCIEKFGSFITDLFPKVTSYTTRTTTPITTTSPTLNAFLSLNMLPTMESTRAIGSTQNRVRNTLKISDHLQWSGTKALTVDNGIGNMLSKWLRKGRHYLKSGLTALSVISPIWLKESLPTNQSSVTKTVKPPRYVGEEKVYNLSVEGVSEYFANGVLVSNCDAFRYLVMSLPEAPDQAKTPPKYMTLEGSLQKELEEKRKPPLKDQWNDY